MSRISAIARRATTRAMKRKANRANRPTQWGFPHRWEHGSYRYLNARGKKAADVVHFIDPALPIGQRVKVISRYTGNVIYTY